MIITLRNAERGTTGTIRVDELPHTLSKDQQDRLREQLGGFPTGPQVGPDDRDLIIDINEDGVITIPGRIYQCRWCRREGQAARNDKKWCSSRCRMMYKRKVADQCAVC